MAKKEVKELPETIIQTSKCIKGDIAQLIIMVSHDFHNRTLIAITGQNDPVYECMHLLFL